MFTLPVGLTALLLIFLGCVAFFFFNPMTRSAWWSDAALGALRARDYVRAEHYYEKLRNLCARLSDPKFKAAIEYVAVTGLATCREHAGDFEAAEKLLRRGAELLEQGVEQSLGVRAHLFAPLAVACRALGKLEESSNAIQQLRECCEDVSEDEVEELSELITGAAAGAGFRNYRETAFEITGIAQAALEQSDGWHDGAFAHVKVSLASFHMMRCEYEAAEALINSAIEEAGDALDQKDLASAWAQLGWGYMLRAEYSDATSAFERSLQIQQDEDGSQSHRTADAIQAVADSWRCFGDYQRAIELSDRAWGILTAALQMNDRMIISTSMRRSMLLLDLGRFDEADDLLARAVELAESESNTTALSSLKLVQGISASTRLRPRQAEQLLAESLSMADEIYGVDDRMTCDFQMIRADNLLYLDRREESLTIIEKVVHIIEANEDGRIVDMAEAGNILAKAQLADGQIDVAEQTIERARRLIDNKVARTNLTRAEFLHTMGRIAHAQGNYAEAIDCFQQALDIRHSVQPPDHPRIAAVLRDSVATLHELGRSAEADQQSRRADQIREKWLSQRGHDPYTPPRATE